jgi:hypothetical protein
LALLVRAGGVDVGPEGRFRRSGPVAEESGVREDRFDELGSPALEAFAGGADEDLVDAVGLGVLAGPLRAPRVVLGRW